VEILCEFNGTVREWARARLIFLEGNHRVVREWNRLPLAAVVALPRQRGLASGRRLDKLGIRWAPDSGCSRRKGELDKTSHMTNNPVMLEG
jgi:hypothetical protein